MPNINHKNKYDCENSHSNNLWQYKRTTDYIGWDKMKDFPGNSKIGAIAFVIENKAYVGLGRSQLNGTVYLVSVIMLTNIAGMFINSTRKSFALYR